MPPYDTLARISTALLFGAVLACGPDGSSSTSKDGPGEASENGEGGAAPPQSIEPGAIKVSTSFSLASSESGTLPFTVGLAFKKGDVPTSFALGIPAGQVDVKRRWSDGSVKHAVVSGHVAMTAGTPVRIDVIGGAYAGGKTLTCDDVAAKAPAVTADLGTLGVVELAPLLVNPVRTWLSGPEVVECHYERVVGGSSVRVAMHVRLYREGRSFVRVIAENGYVDDATEDVTYASKVTIGGAVVLDRSITHRGHTRWMAEGWVGGDPKIVPKHDVAYLKESRLVPNYWKHKPPADSALSSLTQQYGPMDPGDHTPGMSNGGYQPQIGLLPNWDAMYVRSSGDERALRSVIANAKALGSYPIVWREKASGLPARPSVVPTYTVNGPGEGGENGWFAGSLEWDYAHHPSGGFLAYLLTGDYVHLETLQHQASTIYLVNSVAQGTGLDRILKGQTRAMAWGVRSVGQLVGIAPLDEVTKDYRELLARNVAYWNAAIDEGRASPLGVVYEYESNAYAPATSRRGCTTSSSSRTGT